MGDGGRGLGSGAPGRNESEEGDIEGYTSGWGLNEIENELTVKER